MRTVHERVALPDPDTQPLVHPLDLSESRVAYRRAWLLGLLGSPECLVLIGAVAWWATSGWLAPTLAVVSTGGLAELARRHHLADAWSHVPRRRQDHRPDPRSWQVARSLVTSGALVAGVVIVLASLLRRGVDSGVQTYSFGACLGVGAAVLATSGLVWWNRRDSSSLIALGCSVAAVVIGGAVVWAAGWVPASPDVVTVLLGACVVLAVHLAWWRSTRVSAR